MQKIWQEAEALQTELVERRRDLHRHPETGWTEFRTASIVIKPLFRFSPQKPIRIQSFS